MKLPSNNPEESGRWTDHEHIMKSPQAERRFHFPRVKMTWLSFSQLAKQFCLVVKSGLRQVLQCMSHVNSVQVNDLFWASLPHWKPRAMVVTDVVVRLQCVTRCKLSRTWNPLAPCLVCTLTVSTANVHGLKSKEQFRKEEGKQQKLPALLPLR